jgi:hypothetical protein
MTLKEEPLNTWSPGIESVRQNFAARYVTMLCALGDGLPM